MCLGTLPYLTLLALTSLYLNSPYTTYLALLYLLAFPDLNLAYLT